LLKFILAMASLIGGVIITAPGASAISVASQPDIDNNAVISGGVSDSSQLVQSTQPSGISCLYNRFGITSQDINNFDSEAVAGRVTSGGKVIVNGQTVATNAVTAGRQNMTGSTVINCGSHTFYMRPPSVSFASSSLPAYVVMRNGQFVYAVIASCGNPVMATPVVRQTVQPAPVRPIQTPPVTPPAPVQTQTQSQSQTVTVSTPAPVVQSAVVSTPAPAAKALPNTGPGNIAGLGAVSVVFGTVGHYLYQRRKTT
jgi:hypothetical protein